MARIFKEYYPLALLFVVFMAGIFMRPAFPIDETRYLTVAWEMWLKDAWLNLTVNFTPYHHKPPMMFWLMNLCWKIFGVSRWAATLPAIFSSIAVVLLTQRLAKKLFPAQETIVENSRWLMLGSVPFLIYGSLIMFDMMLTMFVLAALLFLLEYAERRKFIYVLGFGLCMGLGALTKGPVVYIYTLLPALLGPMWLPRRDDQKHFWGWEIPCLIALLISGIPVLCWLIPMAKKADFQFLYFLLWEQSVGRVSGDVSFAHTRPFYFYIPLVPVFLAPWILFPSFWRGIKARGQNLRSNAGTLFLLFWIVSGFCAFSFLIGGKQPHYLVPLLPGIIILTAYFMQDVSQIMLRRTVLGIFLVFVIAHAIAMKVYTPLYDWRPVANYIAQYPHKDLAFVRSYHGELGFYARVENYVDDETLETLPEWFEKHPEGLAVIRYKTPEDVAQYENLFSVSYRKFDRYAGVFARRKANK